MLEHLLAERCDLPEIDKTRLSELVDLAVSGGHLGVLKLLFKEGVSLDSTIGELPDDFPIVSGGITHPYMEFSNPYHDPPPMILALDRGHDEVFKYLIDKGCAKSFAERYGNDLIFERVLYLGKVEILQMIFGTLSPNVEDIADMYDGLSIHLAVFGGENVFKFLLDQGVRLRPDSEPHQRAFANAVLLANVHIVKMFLNAGFRPNLHNWVSPIDPSQSVALDESKGGTLLAIAAQAKSPKDAEATVDLLLEYGAQMNHPTGSCDHTPLLSTVSGFARKKIYMIQGHHWTMTRTSAGTHVHHQPSRDKIEAMDLEVQATKLLLKKGAEPLFWGNSGRSALTMAAWNNKIEVVEVLLEFLDQADTPINTIKPHILAAMGPYKACVGSNLHRFICDDDELDAYMNDHPEAREDVSVEVLNQWKKAKEASDVTRRILWHYYWRKIYPCSRQ